MSEIDQQLLQRHGITAERVRPHPGADGRDPNLLELGLFSVMWSEHCSYKSSRVHLKTLPTTGPRVVQGPGENAGAVDIGDGLAAVFKIESHNHPSFIEPYQGAATGVGGIIRDIFTMGARPIALLNALRFGSLETPLARRIFEGVVAGIGGYGNSIGIPTIGGEIVFDEAYAGNPLVNVLCLGLARHDEIIKGQATGVGNPVFYVGAKTGRDGIHGATMASAEFDESSAEKRPAVQVGDPFMEKLLHGGVPRGHEDRRARRHPGHGRRRPHLRHVRDGFARRERHGRRGVARAAARDRHDALRDHALGIAGAHAARGQGRPRARGRSRSSRSGTCTPCASATSPTAAGCGCSTTARWWPTCPRAR